MRYFSMFSGIGGFEYGIQEAYNNRKLLQGERRKGVRGKRTSVEGRQTGFACVGFSEIDKYAISIYKRHFPEHKNYGNATAINEHELPDFDLLVGGFPCQAFSVAGKRKGFMDSRGTLFFEIARILKAKRPRLVLLENVRGLLSHDKGKTFQTILKILSDIGYRVEWQVLNSKDYGVPQSRERIFIAGHLGDGSRPQIFPIAEDGGLSDQDLEQSVQREVCPDRQAGEDGHIHKRQEVEVVGTLDGGGWEKRHEQIRRVHSPLGLSPTIPTGTGGGVMTKFAVPVLTPDRAEKRQNGRRFKEEGEPAFTLTGQDKHGVMIDQGIRRLTPTECERLQGFPDGWTEYGEGDVKISDTQRYKCLGNAVTTNVITRIMENFYEGEENANI